MLAAAFPLPGSAAGARPLISFRGLMAGLRAPLSLLRDRFGGGGHNGGKRRVLVLLGAGASVEYKVPTTDQLTAAIEREIMGDPG